MVILMAVATSRAKMDEQGVDIEQAETWTVLGVEPIPPFWYEVYYLHPDPSIEVVNVIYNLNGFAIGYDYVKDDVLYYFGFSAELGEFVPEPCPFEKEFREQLDGYRPSVKEGA